MPLGSAFGVKDEFLNSSWLSAPEQVRSDSRMNAGCASLLLGCSRGRMSLYPGPTCRLRFTRAIPNIHRPPHPSHPSASQIPTEMHKPKEASSLLAGAAPASGSAALSCFRQEPKASNKTREHFITWTAPQHTSTALGTEQNRKQRTPQPRVQSHESIG